MQVIGIDVGGTNTDATLIGPDWNAAGIVKTPTEHDNILASTKLAFNEILKYLEDDVPVQLHLSTTLSTNAIIEGKGEPVAVVAIPGPGVNPAAFGFDFPIYPVQGYVDHRGRVVEMLILRSPDSSQECQGQRCQGTGCRGEVQPAQQQTGAGCSRCNPAGRLGIRPDYPGASIVGQVELSPADCFRFFER